MKKIERSEILELGEYEKVRPHFLKRMIELKKSRRISVGDHMTFIFENRDTVLFQIQEMLRIERITGETAIQHEMDTYNSLIPGDFELFATLMIEFEDSTMRREKLEEFADLKRSISLSIRNDLVPANFECLPGEEANRIPAINYLRFRIPNHLIEDLASIKNPLSIVIDHPKYQSTENISPSLRWQLISDLENNK